MRPKDIVTRWGWPFTAQPLPAGIPLMQMGECFGNAQWLVHHSATTPRPLLYCEGFITYDGSEPPTHHGFCVDSNGIVLDPTWRYRPTRTYTGVAFRSWILPHYNRIHGPGFSLLGDLELRSLTPAEFEKIAHSPPPVLVAK